MNDLKRLVYLGSKIKVNVSIPAIDSITMDNYDFEVVLFCYPNKSLLLRKEELIRVDESNYVARLDTTLVGEGDLKAKITAYIPDGDFEDRVRTEVIVSLVNVTIVKP